MYPKFLACMKMQILHSRWGWLTVDSSWLIRLQSNQGHFHYFWIESASILNLRLAWITLSSIRISLPRFFSLIQLVDEYLGFIWISFALIDLKINTLDYSGLVWFHSIRNISLTIFNRIFLFRTFWSNPPALQIQETNILVRSVLEVQPRMSTGGSGKTSDEIVYDLAESILGKLPDILDMDNAHKDLFKVKQSIDM